MGGEFDDDVDVCCCVINFSVTNFSVTNFSTLIMKYQYNGKAF